MTNDEATLAMITALEALRIPYMVVGSFSSNAYGVARATQDADFVVQLGETKLSAVMTQLGPGFRLDPQLSFETVTGTTRAIIELVDNPFKIELFFLGEDPHAQERFRRRVRHRILGVETALPTPEDVVITKLRWSVQGKRRKDVDDVRNVIAVQAGRLDWEYILHWCDQHAPVARRNPTRAAVSLINPT
jgi:hypothetical protein